MDTPVSSREMSLNMKDKLSSLLGSGTLEKLGRLGFVLAGGAAAALMDEDEPVCKVSDLDFFYKGIVGGLKAERTLPGLITRKQRSGAAVEVLLRAGFEIKMVTIYAITLVKTIVLDQKTPTVAAPTATAFWNLGKVVKSTSESAVEQLDVTVQLILVAERDTYRYDSVKNLTYYRPIVSTDPSWSRFDFSVVRAEVDGDKILFDPQLPEDRANKLLRIRNYNRNPVDEVRRIAKYIKKGFQLPAWEILKLIGMFASLPKEAQEPIAKLVEYVNGSDDPDKEWWVENNYGGLQLSDEAADKIRSASMAFVSVVYNMENYFMDPELEEPASNRSDEWIYSLTRRLKNTHEMKKDSDHSEADTEIPF